MGNVGIPVLKVIKLKPKKSLIYYYDSIEKFSVDSKINVVVVFISDVYIFVYTELKIYRLVNSSKIIVFESY